MSPASLPPLDEAARGRIPAAVRALAGRRGAAAFDADGTLWRGDVSEDFARWMIDRGDFDGTDWSEYELIDARDPSAGALDILRFWAGHDRARLEEAIAAFWDGGPPRAWITPTLAALRQLSGAGLSVHVVSASPAPLMRPVGAMLGVSVIALELEGRGGRYTGRAAGTPTVGVGKLRRLREREHGPLLLAAGNSICDRELLEAADQAWLIGDDAEMARRAEDRGWLRSPAGDEDGGGGERGRRT